MKDAIVVQNVSKTFRHFKSDRPRTLQEAMIRGMRGMRAKGTFYALRDVSFTVPQGRMIGLLGANGAGKSTLLRIIGGVLQPDAGKVSVNGRIGGLLDLGAGFHPDLTGKENLFINGIISGLTRREMENRYNDIVEFAELEDAIDSPLRTYSSGMKMRLGFSIAAHTDPEILLIDEVLAVGDVAFRRKCFERIDQFKAQGHTILLVTHDTQQVLNLCDDALWMRAGEMMAHDETEIVVEQYLKQMATEKRPQQVVIQEGDPSNQGVSADKLAIRAVHIVDGQGVPQQQIASGDALHIEIEIEALQPIQDAIFSLSIHNQAGQLCFRTNTAAAKASIPQLVGKRTIQLQIEQLNLIGDQYLVSVGAYTPDWAYTYDHQPKVAQFVVQKQAGFKRGILLPSHHWMVESETAVSQKAREFTT